MNVRNIILKAANSIEANPHLFAFQSMSLPDKSCGTPACALGWIAFHARFNFDQNYRAVDKWGGVYSMQNDEVYKLLNIRHYCCFEELTELMGSHKWKLSASDCAEALRKFADARFPAKPRQGIPDDVMSIFEPEPSHEVQ